MSARAQGRGDMILKDIQYMLTITSLRYSRDTQKKAKVTGDTMNVARITR
jgi:hypothetical protein